MRGLNRELAIAGHDYFEVVFYYRSQSGIITSDIKVRKSWELNTEARVTGVRGKRSGDTGVNYSRSAVYRDVERTREETVINPETGLEETITITYYDVEFDLPNTGTQGAAILFVGRKTDKTLLGIGRLTNADGDGNAYTISPNTTQVTFAVEALECGLSPTSTQNSFWTNFYEDGGISESGTNRAPVTMGGQSFYMYRLRDLKADGSNVTNGQYTFRTSEGALSDALRWGIILADAGTYEKKQPRYPTADGRFQYFSVILDDKTQITSSNNGADSIGMPFRNPVNFIFNTQYTTPESVFALAFQIPVCPIYRDAEAGTWYIRASYDSYWLDLDDNIGGAGGAIMFTSGTASELSAYRIRIVAKPYKWLYSYHDDIPDHAGTAGPYSTNPQDMTPFNRYFNVEGLVVALEYANGDFVRYLSNNELSFEIGMKAITPRNGNTPGDKLPVTLYSIQTIAVKFFHPASMITYESSFIIIVDNQYRQYTGIPNTGTPPAARINPDLPPNDTTITYPGITGYLPGSGIPMWNVLVVNDVDGILTLGRFGDFLNTRINYSGGTLTGKPASKTISTFIIIFDQRRSSTSYGSTANPNTLDLNSSLDLQFSNGFPNLILCVGARETSGGSYYETSENAVFVGRGAGTLTYGVFRAWGTANAFYFGRWPFNDYLFGAPPSSSDYHALSNVLRYDYVRPVDTRPPGENEFPGRYYHATYSYLFDAYGPTANGGANSSNYGAGDPIPGAAPGTAPNVNKYFLNDGHGGRFFNVTTDEEEVTFYNRRWLD